MGAKRKGRPPIAPELMERRGAYIKHPERRNHDAPMANGGEPRMPDYFTDDECEKWMELVEDLRDIGILSTECRELLIAYCTAYGGWMKARKAVESSGVALATKDKDGKAQIRRNPFSTELHKYREEMNRLLPEFGLTPSARSRLRATVPDEESPMELLLARMSGVN